MPDYSYNTVLQNAKQYCLHNSKLRFFLNKFGVNKWCYSTEDQAYGVYEVWVFKDGGWVMTSEYTKVS